MKPIVFVAMPFGKKKNPITNIEFNFDDFYDRVFGPLNNDHEINMNFVREDLVDTRGIIHKTMIEKLLLSEYVIADLSFANPNVYYELGIRHCAKRYTTFLIFSDEQLKFDVAPLRAISYKVNNGSISDEEVLRLQKYLKEQILKAKNKIEDDSPIYELLPDLDVKIKISEENTKSFKDRAIWLNNKLEEINQIKISYIPENHEETIKKLRSLEEELGDFNNIHLPIWAQLISCVKDFEQYELQIELLKKIPKCVFDKSLKFNQDLAFALNRLGRHKEAQQILQKCLTNFGQDSETYGLLGRTYKDLYNKEQNRLQKDAYLDNAIEYYTKGFINDMHSYYNGINAAQLLLLKSDKASILEMQDILTSVYFSLRAIPENKMDFWAHASNINCLILQKKYDKAQTQLINLYKFNATKWMFQTTIDDFKRTLEIHKNQTDTTILENIIKSIDDKIMTLTPIK